MQTLEQDDWSAPTGVATAVMGTRRAHALVGAGRLTGRHLYNLQGDSLGSVFEIMLDLGSGQVAYAVLDVSCLSRLNRRLYPVPWEAFQHDGASGRLLLNIDHTRLQSAPAFEHSSWPDMTDPEWALGLREYYGSRSRTNG